LSKVSKTFKQRQWAENIINAVKTIFRPVVNEITALNDISLDICKGEIVAYAGPNGSGKSTTIKLLSGMLAPDSGKVSVLGFNPIKERIKYVGKIGVIYGHRTELWWDQPVSASFEWKKTVWGIPDIQYKRNKDFVVELLDIKNIMNVQARVLSLGQRMRADFGMMLLHEPEILFLDEPTLGLDVETKKGVIEFLKQINQEKKTTIMITSHNMSELEELSSRLVLINKGSLFFDGNFPEFRKQYGNFRKLKLVTDSVNKIDLVGAIFMRTSGYGVHEYSYDSNQFQIMDILGQLKESVNIIDVETNFVDIEDIFIDVYRKMKKHN